MTDTQNKSGLPKSFRFSPDEMEKLEAARDRYGSYKAAIMAGLEALDGIDKAAVLKWIKDNSA